MPRTHVKKRKFQGNQHVSSKRAKSSVNRPQTSTSSEENVVTVQVETPECRTSTQSASARKIGAVEHTSSPNLNSNEVSGYRLIDLAILSTIFQMLPCKNCFECELSLLDGWAVHHTSLSNVIPVDGLKHSILQKKLAIIFK